MSSVAGCCSRLRGGRIIGMLAKWSTRMSVSREVDRRATVVELMENVSFEQTDIYTKKSISWILNDSGNSNRCQTSCMLHFGASQTPDAFDTPLHRKFFVSLPISPTLCVPRLRLNALSKHVPLRYAKTAPIPDILWLVALFRP